MPLRVRKRTKTALVERHPRDSFTLADKLHAGFIETKEDRDRIFNEQLRKTGAEYFVIISYMMWEQTL